jgi:membrane-bound lytic murein transglycosylase F
LAEKPAGVEQVSLDPMTEKSLNRYGSMIKRYADQYQMDWRLVLAMIRQESRFRPDALSHKGAFGLMQIMPVTQAELTDKLQVQELSSPYNNVRAGVFHLRALYRYFGEATGDDRVRISLAAYNAGLGRIRDAQAVAVHLGWNPNSWDEIKTILPLLSRRYGDLHRQVWSGGTPTSGYFKNQKQTITYVENIMQYYDEYKLKLN